MDACHADNTPEDRLLNVVRGVSQVPTDEPQYLSVFWVRGFVNCLSVFRGTGETEDIQAIQN